MCVWVWACITHPHSGRLCPKFTEHKCSCITSFDTLRTCSLVHCLPFALSWINIVHNAASSNQTRIWLEWGFEIFNWPAVKRGSEHGPWCITVTKSHQHFMHTSWPRRVRSRCQTVLLCRWWCYGDSDSRLEQWSSSVGKRGAFEDGQSGRRTWLWKRKRAPSPWWVVRELPALLVTSPRRTGTYLKVCDNEENVPLCFPWLRTFLNTNSSMTQPDWK